MKTKHTLTQLKTSKGFPICFGRESIEFNTSEAFERGDDTYDNFITISEFISFGYHVDSNCIKVEKSDYKLANYFLIPLTEFERLGMIQDCCHILDCTKPSEIDGMCKEHHSVVGKRIFETTTIEHLQSENKRLTEENFELKKEIGVIHARFGELAYEDAQLKLRENTIISHPTTTETELDRKAWEYFLAITTSSIEEAYKTAQSFISHRQSLTNKGGEDA